MKRFLLALSVAALLATLGVFVEPNSRWPSPAYACTVLYPAIDDAVPQSAAVVIASAVSVGGAMNTAPIQSPDPSLFRDPNGRGTPITSLEGIGATLVVEEVLGGNVPAQVKVDEAARESTERAIRILEANPGYRAPCSLDIGVLRWAAGARYVVFLDKGQDGRWNASLRWQISGSEVIVEGNPSLIVSDALYQTYFAGIPVQAYVGDEPPWFFTAKTVPLQSLLAAIRDIKYTRLTPPSTGDGGMWRPSFHAQ